MEFKSDWDAAAARLEAYWAGEVLDRIPVQVTAPRGPRREVTRPDSLETRWTDPEYVLEDNLARFECTWFGGEYLPYIFVNLGPSILGAYLGARLHLQEGTNWQEAVIDDPQSWAVPALDPDNRWWAATRRLTETLAREARGRFLVTHTDLGDASDVLSYLRGPERLCMDFFDCPDEVARLLGAILDRWFVAYDVLADLVRPYQRGTVSWLGVWSAGRIYTLQSDFSGMISPSLYRALILPRAVGQARALDHNFYHLDGVGAIPHLDALLETPEVQGIQWTPGAGQPGALGWIPLYQRCQAAGKRLHIGIAAGEIDTLLEHLSPRGLLLRTKCDSVEEGEAVLARVARWTAAHA